jgi:hypothetical protein
VLLTPLADDSTVQEHSNNMSVIFIQHANDIRDREFVVDEQIADGYISLSFAVQTYGIGRNGKLQLTNRETIVGKGLVILRKESLLSGGILSLIGAAVGSDYRNGTLLLKTKKGAHSSRKEGVLIRK